MQGMPRWAPILDCITKTRTNKCNTMPSKLPKFIIAYRESGHLSRFPELKRIRASLAEAQLLNEMTPTAVPKNQDMQTIRINNDGRDSPVHNKGGSETPGPIDGGDSQ